MTILLSAWLTVVLIAGVFGVVAGVGLLVVPRQMLLESTLLRHWLFEINLSAILNRNQSIERPLYRHHRAFGAAVIAGALTSLIPLLWLHSHSFAMAALTRTLGFLGAQAVLLSAWALVIFVLVVGLFLFIRPSALKGFESATNRWIEPFPSLGNTTVPAERAINRLVLCAPRLVGLLLLAAGIACLRVYAG